MSVHRFAKDLIKYRKSLLLSVFLFAAGVYWGTVNAEFLQQFIGAQVEKLGEISSQLKTESNQELSFFRFIFINNAVKGVLVLFTGALLGIIPALFMVINGMAIGYVLQTAAQGGEDITRLIVQGLLPHGIIEIPAIMIAGAFGLHFGYKVWRSIGEGLTGRRSDKESWGAFMGSAIRASFWIIVLLLIAAGIESTITLYLIR
ncbi:hypothetical protein DCC85_19335 [Paenibacillus sp. CAA11]|uniref:stage II sporulation protein M n=1 Tax=Paenibacillus sp. CAA11 TaxID=1532905 RepID=UPI000D33D6D1|nr:stage II sporulation protein M [Paenibacillus sp. CAA11]AWB46098.1 hypothetical protein DCC85_19335 [Paenibacillus sp. CAA11]